MLFLWLLVGLVVGGLVNLLAYRLPRRKALFSLSATCRYCGATLNFVDKIPLVGFLLGRGKCRACRTRLALTAPLVELSLGALYVALFLRFGVSWIFAVYSLYATILVLVFVIDLEHRLILNVITYPSIAVALALSFVVPGLNGRSGLLGGLFYGGLFFALHVGSVLVYKRSDALGQGDVKLALFIGLILGMPGAISAALVGTALGALAGLWVIMVRKASSKSAIPYGTSLSVGALVVMIWSPWIS